jgi:hypothetical protein
VANYVEEIRKRVLERTKQFRDEMTPRMKEVSYGTKRPNDAEYVAFMRNQVKIYPPELWTLPDGSQVWADPWSADLMTGKVAGGKALLKRIADAEGKVL